MPKLLRVLFLSYIGATALVAASASKGTQIEVLAEHVEGNATQMRANGGVVVYYQNSTLHADRIHFDKKSHLLTLDGHVEMIGFQGTKEQTEHLEIDTKSNKVSFHKLFFSNQNDIWLLSKEGNKSDGNYLFGESILSSCDIENPIWVMRFEKAKYNAQKKYMQLYDAKVYFDKVPVFYTPYLAFTLKRERTSGILFPLFGYSREEGFVYEQPIFWAINPGIDVEFNPQFRTQRSVGGYSTLRFADSPYSKGTLRIGYFKDKRSYTEEKSMEESDHYGVEFLYDRSHLFANREEGYKDGLYTNITLLNDIDYLNLQKTSLQHFGQVPLQESRFNYYISNNSWYGAFYAKYFIDTRLADNSKTIQTFPSLQLHKNTSQFLCEHTSYSIDIQSKQLWRKKGVTLNKAEIHIPIEAHFSFFNDYLDMVVGESLYYGKFFFSHDHTLRYDEFTYSSNVHRILLRSDLIKEYTKGLHIIQPSLTYLSPGNENQEPLSFTAMNTLQPQVGELFEVGLPEEVFSFKLNHYWYNDAMQLIFFQRFLQNYYPKRYNKWGILKNEMQYNWNAWHFYNQLSYNHIYHKMSESSTSIGYRSEKIDMQIEHSFKHNFGIEALGEDAKVVNLDFAYQLNDEMRFDAGISYDLNLQNSRLWHIGFAYKRDCWSMRIAVDADVLPRPAQESGNQEYTQEYGFIIQFNFRPFLNVGSGG